MQLFCFLTEMEKQYGTTGKYICNEPMYAYEAVWQVQSGHPVFSGGPAGNRGKSSVADYGSLCGTPMRISELMLLHWFDRKTGRFFSVLVIGFSLYI